jgi:hypothetical protein
MCIAAVSMEKLSVVHLVTKYLAFVKPKHSLRCSLLGSTKPTLSTDVSSAYSHTLFLCYLF